MKAPSVKIYDKTTLWTCRLQLCRYSSFVCGGADYISPGQPTMLWCVVANDAQVAGWVHARYRHGDVYWVPVSCLRRTQLPGCRSVRHSHSI